jgi:hypothetical protein
MTSKASFLAKIRSATLALADRSRQRHARPAFWQAPPSRTLFG